MSPERVNRKDDERLYQPQIHSRHIRRLHQISEITGLAMTVLVDQALTQFAENAENNSQSPTIPYRRDTP